MRVHREISVYSKEREIPDYNLIGVIKILNKNDLVDIEISEDEQVITGTEDDIVMLGLVASKFTLEGYQKTFSLTFMHIDEATNMMGVSKEQVYGINGRTRCRRFTRPLH